MKSATQISRGNPAGRLVPTAHDRETLVRAPLPPEFGLPTVAPTEPGRWPRSAHDASPETRTQAHGPDRPTARRDASLACRRGRADPWPSCRGGPLATPVCQACGFEVATDGAALDLRTDRTADTLLDIAAYDGAHGVAGRPDPRFFDAFRGLLEPQGVAIRGRVLELGCG